jgi:HK97 family phage portal protein
VITRIGGQQKQLRSFALTDMARWGYTGLRSQTTAVSPAAVAGIPAVARGVRIRSETLAGMQLAVWRGIPPMHEPVTTGWRAKLVANAMPNAQQTYFTFWETVGESLGYRSNAYLWMNSADGQVLEWYALHPDQVMPVGEDEFRVRVRPGFVDPTGQGPAEYRVDTATILHIRGHGAGGTRVAPSPIQLFADALGITISRQKHEQAMWANGTNVQVAVMIPGVTNPEQQQQTRDQWRGIYGGASGEQTAFLPVGSTIEKIGMTMDDAEFAASADLSVHDAARITGVPAELLSLGDAAKPRLMEDTLREFDMFALSPDASRIEDALAACLQLFGNTQTFPQFRSSGLVRGTLATEAVVEHQQIQDGTLLVDEARAGRGRPPLPGTVTLADGTVVPTGMAPQLTPAGAAPTPLAPSTDPAAAE